MSQESKNTKSQTELLLEQAKSVMSKFEEQSDHFDHLRCCAEMNHYNHQEKLNKIMEESLHFNGETYNNLIKHANMIKAAMDCTNQDKDGLAEFQTGLDQIEKNHKRYACIAITISKRHSASFEHIAGGYTTNRDAQRSVQAALQCLNFVDLKEAKESEALWNEQNQRKTTSSNHRQSAYKAKLRSIIQSLSDTTKLAR
ncbi:hypothetical protein GJ496_004823 [Pomphorhynchus laevis]|nr:hypothetical protein GJ496_004823 [Pomphorhynchus laevis]